VVACLGLFGSPPALQEDHQESHSLRGQVKVPPTVMELDRRFVYGKAFEFH
jgi:hypothetical protein